MTESTAGSRRQDGAPATTNDSGNKAKIDPTDDGTETGRSTPESSKSTGQNSVVSEESGNNDRVQTVEEFKNLMYKMQETRRNIVAALLNEKELKSEDVETLQHTYDKLTDRHTRAFQREMCTLTAKLSLNIKDETRGLEKDLKYLRQLLQIRADEPSISWPVLLAKVDLPSILSPYHPESAEKFVEEYEQAVAFLKTFIQPVENNDGKKPIFVTDWDGTMKDYCSQYATNLQRFTRVSAVLTAGPLRGPGILDLTAMPIDGPVMFSGSWGREWWLSGKRVVHEDGISDEGFSALQRLGEEMKDLLHSSDYAPFALVGSGVQRKVDRLTLGVQTVCRHVTQELSSRYQNAVKERMHRVDPDSRVSGPFYCF
ncbi:unnamed protein product [Gongylonema pulchrum]|uniref:T6PP_N domain-containing protein n=1 Tax=Gongylonema pulchrum TaxID=637853 RepID=A0A183DRV7_9BILA|nr:unnamed protein product [Gongylonema pulchrum]